MMRVWDDDARDYIECEAANFTGPLAQYCLLNGEGRGQRYADLLSSRCGASRGELPTCTEAGTRNAQKGVKHGDKVCACGGRMHWQSTSCRACNTEKCRKALGKSIPVPKVCACGRTIARTSRLARCVKCREQARKLKR